MKKQFDIKKLVLLNLPYLLMGLFATNFGEAWRLAQGANASEKFLSLFAVLPGALQSFWPSLHPLDLLVGLCCGAGLRLAVYLKSKNAKKYRHGMEYGSAVGEPVRILLPISTGVPEQCHSHKNRKPDHEQPPQGPKDRQKQKCAGDRRLRFR